jgi:hypothetical protein
MRQDGHNERAKRWSTSTRGSRRALAGGLACLCTLVLGGCAAPSSANGDRPSSAAPAAPSGTNQPVALDDVRVLLHGRRLPFDASGHDPSTRDGTFEVASEVYHVASRHVEDNAIRERMTPSQAREAWRRAAAIAGRDASLVEHEDECARSIRELQTLLRSIRADEAAAGGGSAEHRTSWIRPPRQIMPGRAVLAATYPTTGAVDMRLDQLDHLLASDLAHLILEEDALATMVADGELVIEPSPIRALVVDGLRTSVRSREEGTSVR